MVAATEDPRHCGRLWTPVAEARSSCYSTDCGTRTVQNQSHSWILSRNQLTHNPLVQDGRSMQYGVSAVALVAWDAVAVAPALSVPVAVAVGEAGASAPEFAVSGAVAFFVASIA